MTPAPAIARRTALGAMGATALVALAGCASGARSASALKVVYQDDGTPGLPDYMDGVIAEFQAKHPGASLDVQAVQATEADYYTKVALMNRDASTAPDVIYEDSFQVKADASAGYLEPLDPYLARWADWSQFEKAARAGGTGQDGRQYGVPLGTDVQALWYRRSLLQKAGVTLPWAPKTWDDVLTAARAVKKKVPSVTPMNFFASRVGAEATSVRGLQVLLSGTDDVLLRGSRWVTSSPGFQASLQFIRTLYAEGLGPSNQVTSDPNYQNLLPGMLKAGSLAIDSDGSFISGNWAKTGSAPWAAWQTELGVAPWPTQHGQGPKTTTMSGGWTLAMGSRSAAKPLAFDFITIATNRANALKYAVGLANIPVRSDVAKDAGYTGSSRFASFFSGLVGVTHFRPATAQYPLISNQIAIAADAVSTNLRSVAEAVAGYTVGVTQIAGASGVTKEG